MEKIIKVNTFKDLSGPINMVQGQLAFCEKENKYYVYNEGWKEVKVDLKNKGVEMNLYEMNRQIIAQLPEYGDSQWEAASRIFAEWKEDNLGSFYMLYGKEISYFTLFQKKDDSETDFIFLFNGLKECLNNIGKVHSFDRVDNNAIEIWIDYEGTCTCLYLFNYDSGVCTFNE